MINNSPQKELLEPTKWTIAVNRMNSYHQLGKNHSQLSEPLSQQIEWLKLTIEP